MAPSHLIMGMLHDLTDGHPVAQPLLALRSWDCCTFATSLCVSDVFIEGYERFVIVILPHGFVARLRDFGTWRASDGVMGMLHEWNGLRLRAPF